MLPDMTRLMSWCRLSREGFYRKTWLQAADGGILAAYYPDQDSAPETRLHTLEQMAEAAKSGYLATSDDPLYLIAPGDYIEVTRPDGTTKLNRLDPEEGTSNERFHEEISDTVSAGCAAYGEGSFASAIKVPTGANGPYEPDGFITLAHRDSAESEWVPGPAKRRPWNDFYSEIVPQ